MNEYLKTEFEEILNDIRWGKKDQKEYLGRLILKAPDGWSTKNLSVDQISIRKILDVLKEQEKRTNEKKLKKIENIIKGTSK